MSNDTSAPEQVPEKFIPKGYRFPAQEAQPQATTLAVSLPEAPKLNGSQQLVDQVCSALDAAHKLGIEEVNDMINRLQNVKAAIELKKIASQEAMKDFISSIGQSLQTVQELDPLIKGIEEKHL